MQTSVATYKVEYSMDKGQTWNRTDENNYTINSTLKEFHSYEIDKEGTFRLRITIVSPAAAYIDDITINKTTVSNSSEQIRSDEKTSPYINNGVLHYYVNGKDDKKITVYDMSGRIISAVEGSEGWNALPIFGSSQSFILLQQGSRIYKLHVQ